jgi:hypothetical protein
MKKRTGKLITAVTLLLVLALGVLAGYMLSAATHECDTHTVLFTVGDDADYRPSEPEQSRPQNANMDNPTEGTVSC